MDGSDVTEVCRLCPANAKNHALLNVFDERISVKNNMKEVILVTTGIEILENDLVSKKICQRCCNITLKMFQFRQDALKQDRALKEKCSHYLGDKGIRLPNTCVTIKQEKLIPPVKQLKKEPVTETCSTTNNVKDKLHPSVAQLYQTFPHLKLPKACVDRHMTPVVSLPMGDVEKYFSNRNLDMRKFIYKQRRRSQTKEHSKKVAKKRTTMPTKQKKTIAPLKISKQLFGNFKHANKLENYICTSVRKQKGTRKRSASLSDVDKKLKIKIIEKNELVQSMAVVESAIASTVNTKENQRPVTPVLSPTKPPVEKETIIQPSIPEPSDDSRDSLASNISVRTTTSTISNKEYNMNALESCGLTPTVTATKSQTLLLCNLCASVHNNAFELKRHSMKHMVCQFCKRRFKSLDAKQDHIDYDCEVKKIMNSSGPIVSLEQIHLNPDIRKKYNEAFLFFEPLAGQEPEPVEEVIVRAVSPPPLISQDNLIVLSDDDEIQCLPPDPLSGITTPAEHMVPPAIENVIYSTVSIVRPDVRIKNSPFQYNAMPNLSDKKVIEELVTLYKSNHSSVEKMLQTDLPTNRDIKINHSEGTCEFKNLKEQLLTYKVPVNVNYGAFHVGYQFKKKTKSNNKMAHWSTLPIVNSKKTNPQKSLNISQPADKNVVSLPEVSQSVIVLNSQQHRSTPSVSSTTSAITPQIKPSTSIALPPPLILKNRTTSQPVANNQFPVSYTTSNSATPLLHNYALNMTSSLSVVNNRPIPIPKTLANLAFNKNTVQNSSGSKPLSLPKTYSLQNSLPLTYPHSKQPSAYYRVPGNYYIPAPNCSSTSNQITPVSRLPAAQPASSAVNSTVTQVASSESSKFRVKNVWELQ